MSAANINHVSIVVRSEMSEDQVLPGVVCPMIIFSQVSDFDPRPPEVDLRELG